MKLQRLRELLTTATPAPWRADGAQISALDDKSVVQMVIYDNGGHTESDAALIVDAVNTLSDLLTIAENIGVTEGIDGPSGLYFLDADKIIAAITRIAKP